MTASVVAIAGKGALVAISLERTSDLTGNSGWTSVQQASVSGTPASVTLQDTPPSGTYLYGAQVSDQNNQIGYEPQRYEVTVNPATKATPVVTLSPNSSTITSAQSLTETITVDATSGNPTPTGTVTLSAGTFTSATTSLSSGSTQIVIPAGTLAPYSSYQLTANYSGDSNYNSASGTGSVTVNPVSKTTPTVTLSPSSSTITSAQSLPEMITVSATSGSPTPTGTVTLSGGSFTSAAASLSSGSAQIVIPAGTLAPYSSYQLTANYSGDSNYNSASGTGAVTVNPVSQPAPTVSTGGFANVTSSGASIGALVNPNGADTHGWFEYGTSSTLSGASTTPQQDLGSGTSNVAFNATLSGLSASTTYYLQAVASNGGGTVYGLISSFTTSVGAQISCSSYSSTGSIVGVSQPLRLGFGNSELVASGVGQAILSTPPLARSPRFRSRNIQEVSVVGSLFLTLKRLSRSPI